jgi:hypothetical protein
MNDEFFICWVEAKSRWEIWVLRVRSWRRIHVIHDDRSVITNSRTTLIFNYWFCSTSAHAYTVYTSIRLVWRLYYVFLFCVCYFNWWSY